MDLDMRPLLYYLHELKAMPISCLAYSVRRLPGLMAGVQYASAEITSPPAIVPRAHQVAGATGS